MFSYVFNQPDRRVWDFTLCTKMTNLSMKVNIIQMITSTNLQNLAQCVPLIEKINLTSCLIDDDGIEVLASEMKNKSKLKKLTLSWNRKITDKGAIEISKNFPQITCISFHGSIL